MMLFKLQIVRADDEAPAQAVQLPGGGDAEIDLIRQASAIAVRHQMTRLEQGDFSRRLESAIASHGVGIFRPEKHVRRAIREGLADVMAGQTAAWQTALHADIEEAYRIGLSEAFTALKAKTRALMKQRK